MGGNQENQEDPDLRITRRHLPHWTLRDATYFVTFCLQRGIMTVEEQVVVLDHIRAGDRKFYRLAAIVVMPEHVHMLIRPLTGISLSRIMKGMKGSLARLLNRIRGTSGTIWQDESYDRIIRDGLEFDRKLSYMMENPVKRGLTDDPWTYHGWYFNEDFFNEDFSSPQT